MMTQMMETRAFDFEVRAESNEQYGEHITGRAIVYDTPTEIAGLFTEVIDRRALDHTDLKDVRLLINHNTSMVPLARSRNNTDNSTMQLTVDDGGLTVRANLDVENNADARALYSATSRGDISGMSFMFVVNGESWENLESDHPTRHITDIGRVMEVSAVTFPAYESTSLTARDAQALESARATLESVQAEHRDKAKARLMLKLKLMEG